MSPPLAVFFVYVWPEPRSSAAGVRNLELIRSLRGAGWKVAVVSPSRESAHRDALEAEGISTFSCDPNQSGETDAALSSLSPRLALFDRFLMEEQFGWRAAQLWPGALRLVDTVDLHAVRRARERIARARPGTPNWEELANLSPATLGEDFLRELSSLYRADGAIVVSSWERDFLLNLGFPEDRLLWLPLEGHPAEDPPGFSARSGFVSLGNFRHPPNRDGVDWLLGELWPRLRAALPAAELHLYGAYPPNEISRHRGANGVFAQGHVADHRAALSRHRVLLAPLRYGAGIKGKVLEAWSTGTPALGTPIAFEGMGEAGALFTDLDSFVAKAVELHENEARWVKDRERGFANLERNFQPAELCARFLGFVNESLARLPEIRATNLVGRMLQHHNANSTKYFSRWIEAKNRTQGGS